MKWFKHDANANTDAKLRKVRIKYGMEGYGVYWYCLELIAANVEKHNLSFELEHDAEIIAHDTGIHFERVEEMMRYMVNLNLFEESSGRITCLKMATRTDEYTQKLLRDIGSVPTLSGQTPDSVARKSLLKEENRTEENRTDLKPPSEAPASDPKHTPDDYRLAEWMAQHVIRVAPKSKPPKLDAWADTIRLMRERDDHSHHDIAAVFTFANNDSFWSVNILSPTKLREKFGELDAKMRRARNENTGSSSGTDPNERGISGAERTRRARERARQQESQRCS